MAVQPDDSTVGREAGGNGPTPTKRRAPRGWRGRLECGEVRRVEHNQRADGPSEKKKPRVRYVERAKQDGRPLSTG